MTIFMTTTADGLPTGFWDSAAYGDRGDPDHPETVIPYDAIEITASQHKEFLTYQGARRWNAETGKVEAFAPVPTPATASQVKAECRRRILLIMTEDQQRNTLAAGQAAIMQYGTDPAVWPADLQARQSRALVAWAEIERLRARSNEIEMMEPIPSDVASDELWAA